MVSVERNNQFETHNKHLLAIVVAILTLAHNSTFKSIDQEYKIIYTHRYTHTSTILCLNPSLVQAIRVINYSACTQTGFVKVKLALRLS